MKTQRVFAPRRGNHENPAGFSPPTGHSLTKCAHAGISEQYGGIMLALQVNDIPNELYESILQTAKTENRSIDQQIIFLLKSSLDKTSRRKMKIHSVLQEIDNLNLGNTGTFPNPAELIREDRDR
jgi:hypothetical protein